jgi:hypothetical protein
LDSQHSDYPEFTDFLIEQGIDSVSLNPDAVLKTTLAIAEKEKESPPVVCPVPIVTNLITVSTPAFASAH